MTMQIGGDGNASIPLSFRTEIAVVPFTGIGGDKDYIADAVTYLVAKDLSRLQDVCVISAETTFVYKGKDIDVKEVAQELNVGYLLTGRVEKFNATVRAEVQLIDAKGGSEVWRESFDLEIFDLPIRVTNGVAAQLSMQPFMPGTQYSLNTPGAVTAVELWLRGVALLLQGWTPERTLEAEKLFSEVERLDPSFPFLWAIFSIVLETLYLNRWRNGKADKADRRKGKSAKNEALKLTPNDPLTYYAAGLVRRAEGDHQKALDDFNKALAKNSSYAIAYVQKANELINIGQPWEAPALVEFAMSLKLDDQYLGFACWVLGRAYFFMRKCSSAIPWLEKSIQKRGDLTFNRIFLISAYALSGRFFKAWRERSQFSSMYPQYTLELIRQNDRDVPNNNPVVIRGLRIRDVGLRLALMP